MISSRQNKIITLIREKQGISSSDIASELTVSQSTVKRELSELVDAGYLETKGKARALTYTVTLLGRIHAPVDAHAYCAVEPDKRIGFESFDTTLIINLPRTFFTPTEIAELDEATKRYQERSTGLSETIFAKELERFVIELSWKSSQIEGNTYTLLDTERLIRDGVKAAGHTNDEAQMILNHKTAFEFVLEERTLFSGAPQIAAIEEIHRRLVAGLGVNEGPRKQMIGITGTKYRPLDNPFQLREALEELVQTVRDVEDPYTAALYMLAGLSYIQFFEDGNKRTARLATNAVLLARQCAPLSYRSADEVLYREATLVFYETHSLVPLKELFTAQYLFAADQYGIH